MTFSVFAKLLKGFERDHLNNGSFVIELIDESLEDVTNEDKELLILKTGCSSYNPISSEESARKFYDGTRKISNHNFEVIQKHFERNRFVSYLKNRLLVTDDNYRHLVL